MKKIFTFFSLVLLPRLVLATGEAPAPASLKETFNSQLNQAGGSLGYNLALTGEAFINTVTGKIIAIALGFIGIIFFVMIFMSGYQWLMSGGNPETIKKARQRLINSSLGLAIVLVAYLITIFIYNKLKLAIG
ncbi:MAG: hypothetical protein NTV81_00155 [Candidatus Komeilibacteria bacterium]|nr:hypothetical protein [Candidatus Komeilibacteria bacterium]